MGTWLFRLTLLPPRPQHTHILTQTHTCMYFRKYITNLCQDLETVNSIKHISYAPGYKA